MLASKVVIFGVIDHEQVGAVGRWVPGPLGPSPATALLPESDIVVRFTKSGLNENL